MAIIFNNNKSISEVSGKISAPGRIVQTIETVTTAGVAHASTSPVNIFTSNPITLTNPNNAVLIELHADNRANDWGDAVWNLYYMDIIHNPSGAQLTYTGYRGEQTFNIRHVHRTAIHYPGTLGPHTYTARGWSYQASTTTYITGSDGTPGYLRLTEVAV
jgi:hypothetical protein